MLAILSSIVGIGIGASQSVAYDLFAETVPTKYRGRLIYLSFFGCFGVLYVVIISWIFLADYGWRWVAFACTVPISITLIVGFFWLLESPRWYASMGNYKDAEVLKVLVAAFLFAVVTSNIFPYRPAYNQANSRYKRSRCGRHRIEV